MSTYDDWKLETPYRVEFHGTREVTFELAGFTITASVNGEMDEVELQEIHFGDGEEVHDQSAGWNQLESFFWIRFRDEIVKEAWARALDQGKDV